MRIRTRSIVRTAAAGLFAAVPMVIGPCANVQYPAENTQIIWGVALAIPKAVVSTLDDAYAAWDVEAADVSSE